MTLHLPLAAVVDQCVSAALDAAAEIACLALSGALFSLCLVAGLALALSSGARPMQPASFRASPSAWRGVPSAGRARLVPRS